jgi:hypothetical protein
LINTSLYHCLPHALFLSLPLCVLFLTLFQHEEELLHQIVDLAKTYGPEVSPLSRLPPFSCTCQDQQVDTALCLLVNEALFDVHSLTRTGKTELALNKIRELEQLKESYGSPTIKDCLSFHIYRLKTFVYSASRTWIKAVRSANMAIGKCPMANGGRVQGLGDVLILVSEAYTALDK